MTLSERIRNRMKNALGAGFLVVRQDPKFGPVELGSPRFFWLCVTVCVISTLYLASHSIWAYFAGSRFWNGGPASIGWMAGFLLCAVYLNRSQTRG